MKFGRRGGDGAQKGLAKGHGENLVLKRTLVWFLLILGVLLLLLVGLITITGPDFPAKVINRHADMGNFPLSEQAIKLHKTLFVADLHADSLLWERDLAVASDAGHVDLPRMRQGHLSLQVFSAVSQVPFGLNLYSNSHNSDMLFLTFIWQRWPVSTWFNIEERALYQAHKLHRLAARESEGLYVIKNQEGLAGYLNALADKPVLAGLLALEGVQPIAGKWENFFRLYKAGYRMMGLTHFFDNQVAGSAHGEQKHGLTPFGKQLIPAMESLGIVVDLAHASAQTIDEVLSIASKPVVVSHTGVKGTCDTARNLSDNQIRAIARNGGLIGIGYWSQAVCDITPKGVVAAIKYVADLVGSQHVGLGSDYDGAVKTAFDVSEVSYLTEALLQQGFSEGDIRRIMGGNILRLLRETLINESASSAALLQLEGLLN